MCTGVCIFPVKVAVFGVMKKKSNTVLLLKASAPNPKTFLKQIKIKEKKEVYKVLIKIQTSFKWLRYRFGMIKPTHIRK
jgi:hypothetical protein